MNHKSQFYYNLPCNAEYNVNHLTSLTTNAEYNVNHLTSLTTNAEYNVNLWARMPAAICTGSWQTMYFSCQLCTRFIDI